MSQLFRLKNGTVLLSTEAPGGIYNSGQLKKIAELCSKELAIVKATEDQRLALFVKESEVENVAQQLRAMGLGFRHYQDSLHQPVSCLGELCEEHEQPAMATAMDITKEIASIQLNAPLKIGVNGCARCCTPCHTLDISVVGDASGYRISLGGQTKQMPEFASYFAEGVPPKELPKRLKAVIEAYKNVAEDGETLHDVIERCGVTDFVQALAPYSQDAAHREDPFAKETETPVDLDAVAVEDDLGLEVESEVESESEIEVEAVEDELDLDVEEGVLTDDLEEIPIEREDQGLLEDDLSLEESTEDLGTDIAVESAEDDLSLESELEFEDEVPAEAPLLDDELSLSSDDVELDLAEDEAPVALDDLEEESVPEDLSLGEDELTEELSVDEEVPMTEELSEDVGEEDVLSFDGDADLDLSEDTMDAELDTSASIPEDDIELDDVADTAELELDESLGSDDDLPVDLDDTMTLSETSLDEDLEGIPELDEDLSPEEIPAPIAAAPAPKMPPVPLAAVKEDDFGEEDEMHADMPDFSDEEESAFEEKLQASIDEESRLIAKADKDPNSGDRQAALSLLEQDSTVSLEEESDDLEEDVIDEELEPINEAMEEFPEPGPKDLAHIKARQLGQKLQGSSQNQQFKLSAIAVQDDHMRVTFESGAYVDFDLSALGLGEERSFRLGAQNVSVTSTSEGFILEVDGMRLFHPKSSLPAAS